MLDELLFGKTRAAVLREIYTNPGRRLSFNELVRRLKSGPGAISRELAMLGEAGLISENREGNHRFVSACTSSPLFPELKALISKASGAPAFIREALRGLEDSIELALIFGSVAAATERADSDLDVFVVGTAGYSVVTQRLYSVEERLGRRVQTLYFDANSAVDRASLRKPSTRSLLSGPILFVLGNEAKLQALLSTEGETKNGQKDKPGKPRKRRKTGAARRRA
jgi:DNA-binding transcriptional ArsR family regulator